MDLQELEAVAKAELLRHGLHDWTFGWSRAKRRLGACKYREKRIEIAAYYALHNSAANVRDTLLHEIAHALAGPKAGHGPLWKATARKLGATPRACDTSPETVVKPGNWQATCVTCQQTYHRYRRPPSTTSYRCRCAARTALTFQYVGDPSRQPPTLKPPGSEARWEATCAGCQTIHRRVRKPKPGLWRCGCPRRCQLTWRFHSGDGTVL